MGGLFLILLLSGKKCLFIKFFMIVFGITFIGFCSYINSTFEVRRRRRPKKAAAVLMNVIATTQNSTFEKLIFPLLPHEPGLQHCPCAKRIPPGLITWR
jgi:hypothetical protein